MSFFSSPSVSRLSIRPSFSHTLLLFSSPVFPRILYLFSLFLLLSLILILSSLSFSFFPSSSFYTLSLSPSFPHPHSILSLFLLLSLILSLSSLSLSPSFPYFSLWFSIRISIFPTSLIFFENWSSNFEEKFQNFSLLIPLFKTLPELKYAHSFHVLFLSFCLCFYLF